MNKRNLEISESDEAYFAQINSIYSDYNDAMNIIEAQKKDIRQMLAMLIKEDIPIPDQFIDKYIRKLSDEEIPEPEDISELPPLHIVL